LDRARNETQGIDCTARVSLLGDRVSWPLASRPAPFSLVISVFQRVFTWRSLFGLALLAFAGCAVGVSRDPFAVHAAAPMSQEGATEIKQSEAGESYIDISVLTYNVKGLPWPLRLGLAEPDPDVAMARIGAHLAALRARGLAPDVVLIQEGFVPSAAFIGMAGGYAFGAAGPSRNDAARVARTPADDALAAGADWTRGEGGTPVFDSGLYAFSDHPITVLARRAFGQFACAGYDCLAAKGVLALSVAVPGVPDPVTLVTLHMNANGASGVPEPRALAAHRLQMDRFANVLESLDPVAPLIFGGDLNVKAASSRQRYADQRLGPAGLTAVHVRCAAALAACDARYPAAQASHWLEPRDIQGYRSGRRVHIRPLASAEMFADPQDGGKLSDHIGYLARYRLSWSTAP